MHPAQQPSDQPAEQAHASGSWSPPVDSHVHTEWSWDAPREANMVRSCEQAVAAGLPGVAFTDHLDFTTWTDGDPISAMDLDPHRYARMHVLDITGYLATLDDCRQRFPELRILSGVEIGEAHLWAASAAATACSQLCTMDASRGASHDHSVCTWLSSGGDQLPLACASSAGWSDGCCAGCTPYRSYSFRG